MSGNKGDSTFDLASVIFIYDCQAHDWMHRLQPLLEATLVQELVLLKRKLNSIEAFLGRFPHVRRVIVDATERPIQRL